MAKMNTKRMDYSVEQLRVLLSIMVITMHVVADTIYVADIHSIEYKVLLAYTCLCRGAVPCFLMLSGAFSKCHIKKAVKKASLYVGLCVLVTELYGLNDVLLSSSGLEEFDPVSVLFQYKYHLWYLFAFVATTLVGPIFVAAVEKKPELYQYIFSLYLMFFIVPNTLNLFLPNTALLRFIGMYSPGLPAYSMYYLMGKYLYAHRKQITSWVVRSRFCYLGATVCIFALEYMKTWQNQYHGDVLFENFNVFVMLQALALFFLGIHFPAIRIKILPILAKAGLTIYLVHVFFVDWLTKFGFLSTFLTPLIGVPLKVICVYLLSLMIFLLFRTGYIWLRRLRNRKRPVNGSL